MAITLLYGCCQIELSVADLDRARAFMEGVLGAGRIEQQLAQEIGALFPDGGYRVDHLDCGEAVFQLNEPSPSILYKGQTSVHQTYLDSIGPCVSNLNYYIDDYVHAHELLTSLGAATRIEGPSSAARSLADYGPENTKPGADARPFLFMGTRHLIGLDLELMEPNFLRFTKQTAQYPCFVHPRPMTGDDNLRLQRLRIVVGDLEETYRNLVVLFTPASRSKPYAMREGSQGKAFRIGLGGIEVEYCQPRSANGDLALLLNRYGAGVVSIEFGARNPDRVLANADKASVAIKPEADLLGFGAPLPGWQLAGRDQVGFDVVLDQLDRQQSFGEA